jgi:acyl carrier protein
MDVSEANVHDFIVRLVKDNARRLIGEEAEALEIDENVNLVGSGLIDSLGFMNLLMKVEDHFDLEVDLDDRDPADFTTLNGLVAAVVESR